MQSLGATRGRRSQPHPVSGQLARIGVSMAFGAMLPRCSTPPLDWRAWYFPVRIVLDVMSMVDPAKAAQLGLALVLHKQRATGAGGDKKPKA